MSKLNLQKSAIEISTIVAIIIVAAIVGAVSIIATIKYYDLLNVSAPVVVVAPKLKPIATPTLTVNGEISNWKTYRNEKYGFEFQYPSNLKTKTEFEGDYLFQENLWSIDDNLNNFSGTPIINIPLYDIHKSDSFIMELRIGVSSKPEEVAGCLNFHNGGLGEDKKNINGIDFGIFSIESGGVGHYLFGTSYRTVYKNLCFAIEQINFGTGSQGDLDPTQIQDYRNKGTDTINQILSTFKFTEKGIGSLAVDPVDILGYWFTPHAATRSITFLTKNRFEFYDGENTGFVGNFIIDGSVVMLKFNDNKTKDIILKFSQDNSAKYLQNDEGEYFVKQ